MAPQRGLRGFSPSVGIHTYLLHNHRAERESLKLDNLFPQLPAFTIETIKNPGILSERKNAYRFGNVIIALPAVMRTAL